MLSPLVRRPRNNVKSRAIGLRSAKPPSSERGFTMALVAVSMVAIIAMAALSIDIGTLYEAKAEAQRSADAAALTAARVISISGITGDPGNVASSWQPACGGPTSLATLAAIKVAQQNLIGGVSVPSSGITVNYGAGSAGGSSPSCVGVANFGVNPIVTVNVQRTNLPIFFAHVFSLVGSKVSAATVTASASAEAFNPSGSGGAVTSAMIPVNPRCVKPWIIPNIDPGNAPSQFVSPAIGSIVNQGVWQANKGSINENFNLNADCVPGKTDCLPPLSPTGNMYDNPPTWNSAKLATPLVLEYLPASVQGNAGAVPNTCAATPGFQTAIVGCDQSTVYACGTSGGQVNLNENPLYPSALTGDTYTAVACLTNAAPTYGGADILLPGTYPFQIQAEGGNPLVRQGLVNSGDLITSSNSIVTVPIYDSNPGVPLVVVGGSAPVTIIGFLQVFINNVDTNGNINVTVLNVAGCSNNATNTPVAGTSPVPVRLITPP